MIAEHSQTEPVEQGKEPECLLKGIMNNTIRIARLKLLFLAAKIRSHSGTDTVKYSQHDSRAAGLFRFLEYLDKLRQRISPWLDNKRWTCRHLAGLGIQSRMLSGPLFS